MFHQGLNRLLGASWYMPLVNLIIGAVIIQVQVRIPEHADQLNSPFAWFTLAMMMTSRIVPFAQGIVTAVHAKKSHRPHSRMFSTLSIARYGLVSSSIL